VLATIASADTMYHYTGDTFRTVSGMYTLTDHLSGEFVVRDGFTPRPTTGGADWMAGLVSYSFTDGHQALTEANSAATSLFIALDGVSGAEGNRFRGKIAFSAYLGNTLRYDVDLGGGVTFKADIGDPWQHEQLPTGAPVELSCAVGSTVAIPAD